MAYNLNMNKKNNIYIKATPSFDREAEKLLSSKALDDFLDYISQYPEKGRIISGTSGVRKIRWETGFNSKGKSGGVRILYHYSNDVLILLITVYGKSNKETISNAEKNQLKRSVPLLVDKYIGEL